MILLQIEVRETSAGAGATSAPPTPSTLSLCSGRTAKGEAQETRPSGAGK